MNELLLFHVKQVKTAKDKLEEAIVVVRAGCAHPHVYHTAKLNFEYLSSLPPRSMCGECGFEEAGRMFSSMERWDTDSSAPVLQNKPGRSLEQVDREAFFNLRIG